MYLQRRLLHLELQAIREAQRTGYLGVVCHKRDDLLGGARPAEDEEGSSLENENVLFVKASRKFPLRKSKLRRDSNAQKNCSKKD